MGLFKRKKTSTTPEEAIIAKSEEFFTDELRDDLRKKSSEYFERVINENATLFKQDLDATVAHINTELRQRVARQLDDQFNDINQANTELRQYVKEQFDKQIAEYASTIKDSENVALEALNKSAEALRKQHEDLAGAIEKSVANQDAVFSEVSSESKRKLEEITKVQAGIVISLKAGADALQAQQAKITEMLERGIKDREQMLITAFENNMAKIVEHYLLEAIGDAYDLRSQVPSIITSLEQNKQSIKDDMEL